MERRQNRGKQGTEHRIEIFRFIYSIFYISFVYNNLRLECRSQIDLGIYQDFPSFWSS